MVSATDSNLQFSSVSAFEPTQKLCNRFRPIEKPNITELTFPWQIQHLSMLRTFSPIKYLNSGHITIWYKYKLCNVGWSFTSHFPICHLINIHWITVNKTYRAECLRSDSAMYWSDLKLKNCRWKSIVTFTDTVYIILTYDPSSNSELELEYSVRAKRLCYTHDLAEISQW
jgi:hypothetical protein